VGKAETVPPRLIGGSAGQRTMDRAPAFVLNSISYAIVLVSFFGQIPTINESLQFGSSRNWTELCLGLSMGYRACGGSGDENVPASPPSGL
jgi:hypothetical protein